MLNSIIKVLQAYIALLYVIQVIHSAPCSDKLVTPRSVVERISKSGWMLVKGMSWQELKDRLNLQPRQRRSVNRTTSRYCSWNVELDDNVNRNPRFLPKAVCTGCPWYCKPVDYEHRVLIRDCNTLRTHKEKMTVYRWERITLPVAFVYDP